MSKGNLFLGFARGKVGDLVFSRLDGAQVTRARNRQPKNPRSALQMLQRVVMKTSSQAYSMMRDICDHSFQGMQAGTPNQSRFAALNVQMLRGVLADEINSGEAADILTSSQTNFALRGSVLPPVNPYVVSEGTLPSMGAFFGDSYEAIVDPLGSAALASSGFSYQNLVDFLGAQRGDQLTFLMFQTDDSAAEKAGFFTSFRYARIILEPDNGDMTTAFMGDTGVQHPNPKNEGEVKLLSSSDEGRRRLAFAFPGVNDGRGTARAFAGAAVILSRQSGGVWQRSSEVISVRGSEGDSALVHPTGVLPLSDAIASFMSADNSGLYLNQAEG